MKTERKVMQRLIPLILLVLPFCSGAEEARSQSGRGVGADTGTLVAPAMLRMWNWPDTTFLIGAYGAGDALYGPNGEAGEIWPFLESLGIDLYVSANYFNPGNVNDSLSTLRYFDTLAWSTDVSQGRRIAQWDGWPFANQIGYARAVEFYPFDSVQSPYYLFRFESTKDSVYGVSEFNPVEVGVDSSALREQWYDSVTTTPGTVIAEQISFNEWDEDAQRVYRWASQAQDHGGDSVQKVDRWIIDDLVVNDAGRPNTPRLDSLYYIVVTGHLFPLGSSSDTDSLLKIEVIYEVPKNAYFYTGTSFPPTQASTDTTFPVTTFFVTKNDLLPDPNNIPLIWDEYREVVFPLDLRFLENGAWGPTNPNTLDTLIGETSRRFDIRVTWLGGEQLALRSVSLRSQHGQLTLGTDAGAKAWRQERINLIRRLLYGSDAYDVPADSLRRAYIGIHPAEEQHPTAYAGLEYLTQMVRDTFNVPRPGGAPGERDSVGEFTAQSYIADLFHHHHLSTPSTTVIENYLWMQPVQGTDSVNNRTWFGLTHEELPNIREENGGRFYLGEIDIDDPNGIEEYEKTLQHLRIGRYIPDWSIFGPYDPATSTGTHPTWRKRWGLLHRLGDAARVSRATGRRLIQVPSNNGSIELKRYEENGVWKLDTLVGHMPTAAELKLVANLGLAYGSKGAVYWWLPSSVDIAHDRAPDLSVWGTEGVSAGLGPIGSDYEGAHTWDTVRDTDDWDLHSGHHVPKSEPVTTIPDFYVGFGTRTRALRDVNRRLSEIGKVMMGLTWRESYSIHYTVPRPGAGTNGMLDFKHRPIDSGEIVSSVRTWDPRTGVVDSTWATFVEVGLFDKKVGANYMLDTHHLYIVNRRTFERPDHVLATTSRGRKMDSLTENRTIEIRFNLPNPDTSNQYNEWIRVREVLPTYDTLALLGVRKPLDSVIVGDGGKVRITLPPGAGTLLEVSFTQPDESMAPGDLTRNNQRKIVYEPITDRYYSTYFRWDSALNDYHVFFRRSLPMQGLGAILWEPMEWPVSGTMVADQPRTMNTHPSITLRTRSNKALPRISIVWTAHLNDTGFAGRREVLIRDIQYFKVADSEGDTIEDMFVLPIRNVGYHYGLDPYRWGTPVISSASGESGIGDYIAWSDSTAGIVARGRLMDTNFLNFPVWTPLDTLSNWYNAQAGYGPGQYPAMPPFTHRGMNQQSTPVVWQQSDTNPYGVYYGIVYGRLNYVPPPTGPELHYAQATNMVNPPFYISPNPISYPGAGLPQSTLANHYLHPSIDQSQDGLGRVMEGITWEWYRIVPVYINGQWAYDDYLSDLYFTAILFDTAVSLPIQMGTWASRPVYLDGIQKYAFPVVSSQNQIMVPADSAASPLFTLVFQDDNQTLNIRQFVAKWRMNATPQWQNGEAQAFSYRGENPNGTASEGKLVNRYAVLYGLEADSTLRTSREYYARTRPDGYLADGREVGAGLDDSLGIGFTARLLDVWFSDADESRPLSLVPESVPDSLSDLLALLRTEPFMTGDSTAIGGEMEVRIFYGDSTACAGKEIDFMLELVDSATEEVVFLLDSTRLDVTTDPAQCRISDTVIDLLSGTYYVRLRLASDDLLSNFDLDSTSGRMMGHVQKWIESLAGKRVRRLAGDAEAGLRVAAQPNPFTGETEIRFSVGRNEHVTLTVYDAHGREVRSLIGKEFYPAGRYAVEFSGEDLPSGTYLIELRTLNGRVAGKLILKR